MREEMKENEPDEVASEAGWGGGGREGGGREGGGGEGSGGGWEKVVGEAAP